MITIKIHKRFNNQCVAELNITDRLTLVSGDSSTGKTKICSMLEDREGSAFRVEVYDSKKNKVDLHYCTSLNRFEEVLLDSSKDMSVVVIDEYVATEINKIENKVIRGKIAKTCKYTVIFQRDCIVKYNVGVNSVMHVQYQNGMYKFIKPLAFNDNIELGNITKCNVVLMEDSKSGAKILSKYLPNNMVKTSRGNGDMPKELEILYSKENVLCGLDYDQGGTALYNINNLVKEQSLDRGSLYFINMESFEEVLCNAEFILSKIPILRDYVNNMEKHMDCTFAHRGDYFLNLLKRMLYSSNATYQKNSFSCFTTNCRDCQNKQCKFREETKDKIDVLFSNKYDLLYQFCKYHNNK